MTPSSEVENAGGIVEFVKTVLTFVVHLTENVAEATYTADKTYAEIYAAYQAHRLIMVIVNGSAVLPLLNAEFNDEAAGFTFGYTQVRTDGSSIVTRAIHYLHTADSDEWSDADVDSEPLLVSGGTLDGELNMASNNIINVQKIHIDGSAPVYIGATIEPAGTGGVRITGTTDGEIAIVEPTSQSKYRPIRVGNPTKDEHAVTKKHMEDTMDSKLAELFEFDEDTGILNILL